jgi:ERCC4-type nuclease
VTWIWRSVECPGLLHQPVTILVDTRQRYPYKFTRQEHTNTERRALPAGDYGVEFDDEVVAAVERKSIDDLSRRLVDGQLAYALA